ncbi:MAG: hypothetical protein HY023_03665, partial [Chloroflexi bacterium]|nr:hypothetical protein [Chloroflexota bacterium]
VVERLWSAVIGKWGIVVGLVGLWVGVHLSWANWLAWDWRPGAPLVVVAALGLLAGGGYWLTRSVVARRLIVLGVFSAGIILSLIRGPLDWGLTAPYSPEPYNGILQKVELKYHP